MKKFIIVLSILAITYTAFAETQFNYCLESSPDRLDPAQTVLGVSLIVGRQIFDSLVAIDPRNGNIVPSLAEYWEISPDGKKYLFHLRKGIKFQSNSIFKPTREMQADDVVFSINRQLNKKEKYYNDGNYVWANILNWGLVIRDIKAVDKYTVEFDLAIARSPFLLELAMPQAWIMSKEYADKLVAQNQLSKLDEQPIGQVLINLPSLIKTLLFLTSLMVIGENKAILVRL